MSKFRPDVREVERRKKTIMPVSMAPDLHDRMIDQLGRINSAVEGGREMSKSEFVRQMIDHCLKDMEESE